MLHRDNDYSETASISCVLRVYYTRLLIITLVSRSGNSISATYIINGIIKILIISTMVRGHICIVVNVCVLLAADPKSTPWIVLPDYLQL